MEILEWTEQFQAILKPRKEKTNETQGRTGRSRRMSRRVTIQNNRLIGISDSSMGELRYRRMLTLNTSRRSYNKTNVSEWQSYENNQADEPTSKMLMTCRDCILTGFTTAVTVTDGSPLNS